MLLTVAVLAVALASSAAAGWRGLRIDGSSEAAFAKSLDEFKDKLSPAHRYVLGEALKDIWMQGERAAQAEQRQYTDSDYYEQLHGLSYKEIVRLTDPTGGTARDRYRVASLTQRYSAPAGSAHDWTGGGSPPIGFSGQQVRGATQSDMLPAGQAASGQPCGGCVLKLAVAVLAVALAGSAAAGWRDLRVDGSSEEAFAQSMAAFRHELSPARQYAFGEALKDIWIQGATAAEAEQRDYTADEYYGLLAGFSYDDVVNRFPSWSTRFGWCPRPAVSGV